jgi:two-component system OmpR family sensor kinase
MMRSVRGKLVLSLALTVVLTAVSLIALSLYIYRENSLHERAIRLLAWGQVVGDLGREARSQIAEFSERSDARILLLDREGRVNTDSSGGRFTGQLFQHREVRTALTTGKTAQGVSKLPEDGWVMYVTVPVMTGKEVTGLVFLSHDINDIYEGLRRFAWRLSGVTLFVLVLVIILGYFLAGKATASLQEMTKAIRLMGKGYLRQRLRVRGTDEVARLAEAFNEMSQELEKGDEELRAFVANASHELRSPVSAMKTLVEAAMVQIKEGKEREYLEDIDKETDRLTKLLQDLLVLARLEDRTFTWEPARVNLSLCVKLVVESFRTTAKKRKIRLQEEITPDLFVWGQAVLLERLVYNLLDNALKYTNATGRVKVSLSQEGEEFLLKIADTGIGIPAPARELVWQRFFRLDKARSRELGGSGLGLSLVRQIAELHRATLELASEEGQGTSITVTFHKV